MAESDPSPHFEEINAARAARKRANGKPMTLEALSTVSGVGYETIKKICSGATARPSDGHMAKIFEGLNTTAEEMPYYALARARWLLDPDRDGLEAAMKFLAGFPAANDPEQAATQLLIATAESEGQQPSETPTSSQRNRRDEGGAGAAP